MDTENNQPAPVLDNKMLPKHAVVSPGNFVLFSVITFGFYQIYWAWRVWETVRRSKGETYTLKSSLRAWFLRFSSFSLLSQLKELAIAKNIPTTYNAVLLGILYLILSFAGNSNETPLEVTLIAILLSSIVLMPVVKTHNAYVEATDAEFTPTNTNWALIAFLVIVYGSIFAFFAFIV